MLVDVEDVVGKVSMGSKYWVLAVGRTVSDLLVRVWIIVVFVEDELLIV